MMYHNKVAGVKTIQLWLLYAELYGSGATIADEGNPSYAGTITSHNCMFSPLDTSSTGDKIVSCCMVTNESSVMSASVKETRPPVEFVTTIDN